MTLTVGHIIISLVLIGFSFFTMQVTPSGDCTKLYKDQIQINKCNGMQTISTIIVIMTVIIVMLIVINGIFSEPKNKTESPWKLLPKGYDKNRNNDEVDN